MVGLLCCRPCQHRTLSSLRNPRLSVHCEGRMEIQRRTMTRWSSIGSRHATAAACRQVWGVQEAERSDSASGNSGCIRVGLSPLTQTRRVSSETEAVEARLTSPLQSAVAAATTLPTSLPLSPLTLAFGRSHRAHCRRCAACSRAASVLNVQKCWQADEGCRAALACTVVAAQHVAEQRGKVQNSAGRLLKDAALLSHACTFHQRTDGR
jgi:hypothetical protein